MELVEIPEIPIKWGGGGVLGQLKVMLIKNVFCTGNFLITKQTQRKK